MYDTTTGKRQKKISSVDESKIIVNVVVGRKYFDCVRRKEIVSSIWKRQKQK